jgi:hypothetical protein
MSDAWETPVTTGCADPIFKNQVTAIDSDLDAVPEKGYDTVSRHEQFDGGIVGLGS